VPNWRPALLGDVLRLKRGYDLPKAARKPGTIPIVSSSGVTDTHSESRVKGPGVVTGRYGTIGEVFYVPEDFWPLNTALYVEDFKGNDPRFISYFLRSINFQAYSDKAAVPGVNRNHLHTAQVRFPFSLREQQAIAGVLAALDDKIELNRRMSETLESLSRSLFQAWLVNTQEEDNPRAPTWAQKPLDKIADFLNGAACQRFPPTGYDASLPVVKIRELRQGITPQSDRVAASIPKKWHIQDGDVLFSWSGTLLARVWTGGEAALNQHLFKVTSEDFPKWFYLHWVLHHLDRFQDIAADKATTMGHIRRHHLSEASCLIPDSDSLEEMDRVMKPLLDWCSTAAGHSNGIVMLS